MNGLLCDVLVIDETTGKANYYRELPRQYVMSREEFATAKHAFIFYLAYGFDR